jgi:hypothetical protein
MVRAQMIHPQPPTVSRWNRWYQPGTIDRSSSLLLRHPQPPALLPAHDLGHFQNDLRTS